MSMKSGGKMGSYSMSMKSGGKMMGYGSSSMSMKSGGKMMGYSSSMSMKSGGKMMGYSSSMSMKSGGKMGYSMSMKGKMGSYPSYDDYDSSGDDASTDDGICCHQWLTHCYPAPYSGGKMMGSKKSGKYQDQVCEPYCAQPCEDDGYDDCK